MSAPHFQANAFPFPNELIVNFFPFLAPTDLLSFKTTCRGYKSLVEKDTHSQKRIAEYYLKIKPFNANIPQTDLKYFCDHTCFAIQVQGDFNIYHLAHDLTPTLAWVSHLIIKNCENNTKFLEELFECLKNINHLSALYLFRCKLDEASSGTLLKIAENTSKQRDFKVYYSKTEEEPPRMIATSPIIETLSEEDDRFNIENLESGDDTLDAFVKEVSNANAPSSSVLEALDALKSTTKMEVIKSIWNSALMGFSEDIQSTNRIIQQTLLYIKEHPHHPALVSAAKANRKKTPALK